MFISAADRWPAAGRPGCLAMWASPGKRAVLLGDAAHAMHPNPGQGARSAFEVRTHVATLWISYNRLFEQGSHSVAVPPAPFPRQDAHQLCEALAESWPDVAGAVARYEARRIPRRTLS